MVFKALIIYRVQLIFEPVLSVDNLAGFLIESALHIILDPVYPHPVLSLVDAVASHSERSLGLFESVFQLSSGKQITKLKTSQLCDLFPLYLVLIIILVSFLFLFSSALSSDLQLEMFLTLSSSCWSTCLWLATVLRSRSAISLRASPRILSDCWRDWSELHRWIFRDYSALG